VIQKSIGINAQTDFYNIKSNSNPDRFYVY